MADWGDDYDDDDQYEGEETYSLAPEDIIATATCVYPFESTNEVELNLEEGDIVNITRTDVGGGWWEGELNGRVGLFPESYVQMNEGEAAAAGDAGDYDQRGDDYTPSAHFNEEAANAPTGAPVVLAGQRWRCDQEAFVIETTTKADKGKKFSGMKTFTMYEIKSSAYERKVERRFKHFAWLHSRLTEQFPCVIIPPIPEKQVQGRFDGDFIENRRQKLERFLNRVARHPVMGSSSVFRHFLTVGDHKAWKSGKRDAEQAAHNSKFLNDVMLEEPTPGNAPDFIATCKRHTAWLDKQMAGLMLQCEDLLKHRVLISESYDKFSERFKRCADPTVFQESERPAYEPWWDDGTPNALTSVLNTLGTVGEGITQISALTKEQETHDRGHVLGFLREYHGLLKTVSAVNKQHDSAWEEYSSAAKKEATPPNVLEDLKRKAETTSSVVLAEYRHLHESLVDDMNHAMSEFIAQQTYYHSRASELWNELAAEYPGFPAEYATEQ